MKNLRLSLRENSSFLSQLLNPNISGYLGLPNRYSSKITMKCPDSGPDSTRQMVNYSSSGPSLLCDRERERERGGDQNWSNGERKTLSQPRDSVESIAPSVYSLNHQANLRWTMATPADSTNEIATAHQA